MKKIVLSQYIKDNINAGPKAKIDVEKILKEEYNFDIKNIPVTEDILNNKFKRIILNLKKLFYTRNNCKHADIVVIQHPYSSQKIIYKNIQNNIVFIHDIDGLRIQNKKILDKELELFKNADIIIAHNNKMKNFLVNNGIMKEKIYVLELFDYLQSNYVPKELNAIEINNIQIAYTGNIDKAKFLYELNEEKMNFDINVYGPCSDNSFCEKVIYKGKFSPDEIVNNIEGNLGLVWDGKLDESDENVGFKNYTKYNNPHKLSCYLAAGLPVIVWRKAAVADFVQKNNIGYTISNIYDINNLDFSTLEEKKKNAKIIGEKVRNGFFTKKIMKKILLKKGIEI